VAVQSLNCWNHCHKASESGGWRLESDALRAPHGLIPSARLASGLLKQYIRYNNLAWFLEIVSNGARYS
jgi:hypothetical protein